MHNEELRSIVQKLTRRKMGVFEELLQREIFIFLEDIDNILGTFNQLCPEISCCTHDILYNLGDTMLDTLIEICIRTFVGEIHDNKHSLIGKSSKDRYDDFIGRYCEFKTDRIFCRWPELEWLVNNRLSLTVEAIGEFMERLRKDREALRNELGVNIYRLNYFSIGRGDAHGRGRSVYVLNINEGEHVVYKPHSVTNDILYSQLQNWFNGFDTIKVKLKHPAVLERKDYGWQSFVEYVECLNLTDANEYMYRLGYLLFISYLTGCTDLHVENIIAHGAYPMVIDTETIFMNMYSFQGYLMNKAEGWERVLAQSVFSSLLLPFDLVANKKLDYVDISGILRGSDKNLKKKIKIQTIINKGTDEIMFATQEQEIQVVGNHNIPMLNGEKLHAGDYLEHIVHGFEDAYSTLLNNRQAFISFISTTSLSKGRYRQILRNTSLYSKYLLASYHPIYLKTTHNRREVYCHLKGKKEYISKEHEKIVECEIEQLMQDDVPCFYARYDSKSLYSVYGREIENFYSKTIREQFVDRINSLNPIDRYRQLYFIRCAIADKKTNSNTAIIVPREVFLKKEFKSVILEMIKWIYEFRETYHKIPSKRGTSFQYYCIALSGEQRKLEVEPPDLYAGIGSALFYIQLGRLLGANYADQAHVLVDILGDKQSDFLREHIPFSNNLGLFTGVGSLIYLNYYAYKVYGDDKYLKRMNMLCDETVINIDNYEAVSDIVSGYSGLIVFSLGAWKKDITLKKLYRLAECCGERLFKQYINGMLPYQSGLAHGYAGISLALIMLGSIAQNSEYYEAGVHLLAREQNFYDPITDSWLISEENMSMNAWCYGAAGILVARTIALDYIHPLDLEIVEKDIALCLRQVKREIYNYNSPPILCHGYPGNIDILLWYAQKVGDKSLYALVENATIRTIMKIKEDGLDFGQAAKVPNISFMQGLTGLGYFLERFLDSKIPSVLAFDPFNEGGNNEEN